MQEDYEQWYHQIEEKQWWFITRRNIIIQLTKKVPSDSKILDIGCSSGTLLKQLINAGFKKENLFGIDISEKAINNCRANNLDQCFVMDAQDINLPLHSFDVIIASDCLEHLSDDLTALQKWNNLLTDSGVLIVFVPAYNFLWNAHDEVNKHYRRYTCKELRTKLKQSGFTVTRHGYWIFILFIPTMIWRLLSNMLRSKKPKNTGNLIMPNPVINKFLTWLINIENGCMKILRFPFGVSTFCVAARKK